LSGLSGRRILVVEDEYFIADDLVVALRAAGAEIIGPASTWQEALSMLEATPPDLAILDINLRGENGFAVADALAARGLPFVFATGYDPSAIPERHAGRPVWQKPFDVNDIAAALSQDIAEVPAKS
jgi:CheY-like chemotaxis protein